VKGKVKAKQEKFKALMKGRTDEEVEFNKVQYKTAKRRQRKLWRWQRTMLMRGYIRDLTLRDGRMRSSNWLGLGRDIEEILVV